MIKIQTIFCWIITCITCFYFNFYTLSKLSSLSEAQYYQNMEKKYDDLNLRLSKETILKIDGDPDSIQNLFDIIISKNKENNSDFKENFNKLIKNKTEEFLNILKTKKVVYTIQRSPSISDYINKEGFRNPNLKELNSYLNEQLALSKNEIGSYSKEKQVPEAIKFFLSSLFVAIAMFIICIMIFGLELINSLYSFFIIMGTHIITTGYVLFFIH